MIVVLFFTYTVMQLGNLTISFIEKITIRELQQLNRINLKFQNKEIDEIELWNQLAQIIITNINGETDKEAILNNILDIESIEDYTILTEAVASTINDLINPSKKKN